MVAVETLTRESAFETFERQVEEQTVQDEADGEVRNTAFYLTKEEVKPLGMILHTMEQEQKTLLTLANNRHKIETIPAQRRVQEAEAGLAQDLADYRLIKDVLRSPRNQGLVISASPEEGDASLARPINSIEIDTGQGEPIKWGADRLEIFLQTIEQGESLEPVRRSETHSKFFDMKLILQMRGRVDLYGPTAQNTHKST